MRSLMLYVSKRVIYVQKTTVNKAVSTAQRMKKTGKFSFGNIFSVILCFLISRAELFGNATPLGTAFFAAVSNCGAPKIIYAVAAVFGLITSGAGFVYIPSVVILFFIMYFEHASDERNRRITALYSGASVLVSGLPAVLWLGGYVLDMLRLLVASSAVFFAVHVFGTSLGVINSKKLRHFLSQEEFISLVLTFSVAALGISSAKIGYVTPVNVICSFFIMLSALCGNPGTSAAAGIVCGFVFGSESNSIFSYMGTCGLCGLASGIMGRFGKSGAAVTFLLCTIINAASVAAVENIIFPPIDTAIAVLIFFAFPVKYLENFGMYRNSTKNEEAVSAVSAVRDRLGFLSGAFLQLSDSIRFFGKGDGKKHIGRFDMFDSASDKVCRDCENCSLCWQKYYNDTYDITMKCFHEVDKCGAVSVDFLPDFFRERCIDCNEFVRSINRTYEEFKGELVWRGRLSESGELSAVRFADAAKVVDKLCAELRDNASFNAELARGVAAALDGAGIAVNSASVFKNPYGRYEVKIKTPGCGGRNICKNAEPVISEIVERSMVKTDGDCMIGECCILFSESSLVSAEHNIAGICAKGEDVSGDCAAAYTLPDGNELLMICDGRGNGREANLLSCETVRLISKLINAGFAPDAAVRFANTAMAETGDGENFSTVDILVIDTLNGNCIFVKNGCCPTFVINKGEIKRIGCENLPVGVGDETDVTEKYGSFEDGDIIIMMSDGVYDSFSNEKELKNEIMKVSSYCNSEKISSGLLKTARKKQRKNDDMTVLAAKIKFL